MRSAHWRSTSTEWTMFCSMHLVRSSNTAIFVDVEPVLITRIRFNKSLLVRSGLLLAAAPRCQQPDGPSGRCCFQISAYDPPVSKKKPKEKLCTKICAKLFPVLAFSGLVTGPSPAGQSAPGAAPCGARPTPRPGQRSPQRLSCAARSCSGRRSRSAPSSGRNGSSGQYCRRY